MVKRRDLEAEQAETRRRLLGDDEDSEIEGGSARYGMEFDGTEEYEALKTQVGGSHYKGWYIEPLEFIIKNSNKLSGAEAAIIKYACRHRDKGRVEDLQKIIHYCKAIAEIHYGVQI